MTSSKHGAMAWGDDSLKTGANKKGSGGKDSWMRLKSGSNLVRVLTEPHLYYQHKYKFDGEKGYGHRIPCAKPKSCVVCNQGDKAKRRWYLGVIDRSTNTYKILDVSWSVLSDIQTYANDDDWGDPSGYDFDIVMNPTASPQDFYKAVAKPKRPLSANDMLIKDQGVDLEYLERRCLPADPELVETKFNELKKEANKSNSDASDSSVDFGSSSDEEEADFPNADTQEMPF